MEEENIKVVVRVRPLQLQEKKDGDIACVKPVSGGKEVQVKVGPLDAQVYRCNNCFPNDTSQLLFFNESGITDLVDSAIEGYRCCAFAFGQTGAGKTFTMVGSTKGISHRDKQIGMVGRSIEYLFNTMATLKTEFKVKISCLEIYHEHVYDLFADEKDRVSLPVREHATEGFFLEGCKLVECRSYEIACDLLDVAMQQRKVGIHDANSRSSRSHCITDIYIETPASDLVVNSEMGSQSEHGYLLRGRLSLVDLAGSERLKSTNSSGKVLQEAGFINRSLYVLGKVIAGLVRTNGDLNHKDVPFRDSKLTKLLIGSLGGRSRTLLIACVSEAKSSQTETLRTLKFSMACARIKNKPVKFLDPHDKLVLELREEVKRLRDENKKLRQTMGTAPVHGSAAYTDNGEYLRASSAESPNSRRSPTKAKAGIAGGAASKKKMAAKEHVPSARHADFLAQHGKAVGGKKLKKKKKSEKMSHDAEDDLLQLLSDSNAAGVHPNHRYDRQEGANDKDDDSVGHSVHSGASSSQYGGKRIPGVADMVRGVHPMVFKNADNMMPLRDSNQGKGLSPSYVANNYERSLEATRLEELERRMARIELVEKARLSQESNYEGSAEHNPSSASHIVKVKKEKKSHVSAAVEHEQKLLKEQIAKHPPAKEVSPYIVHLINNTEKAKVKMPINNKKRDVVENNSSSTVAGDDADSAAAKKRPVVRRNSKHGNSTNSDAAASDGEHPKQQQLQITTGDSSNDDEESVARMRQQKRINAREAIDRELEELGMGPSSSNTSQVSHASAPSLLHHVEPHHNTKKKKTVAAAPTGKPPLNKHQIAPANHNSNIAAPKLPLISKGNNVGKNIFGLAAKPILQSAVDKEAQLRLYPELAQGGPKPRSKLAGARYVPLARSEDEGDSFSSVHTSSLPPMTDSKMVMGEAVFSAKDFDFATSDEEDTGGGGGSHSLINSASEPTVKSGKFAAASKSPPPSGHELNRSVELVSRKLNILQQSLVSQRMEMEDNPGSVTAEDEERHFALESEALTMQEELERILSTGNINIMSQTNARRVHNAGVEKRVGLGDTGRPPEGSKVGFAITATEDDYGEEEGDDYEDDDWGAAEEDGQGGGGGGEGGRSRGRSRGGAATATVVSDEADGDGVYVAAKSSKSSVTAAAAAAAASSTGSSSYDGGSSSSKRPDGLNSYSGKSGSVPPKRSPTPKASMRPNSEGGYDDDDAYAGDDFDQEEGSFDHEEQQQQPSLQPVVQRQQQSPSSSMKRNSPSGGSSSTSSGVHAPSLPSSSSSFSASQAAPAVLVSKKESPRATAVHQQQQQHHQQQQQQQQLLSSPVQLTSAGNADDYEYDQEEFSQSFENEQTATTLKQQQQSSSAAATTAIDERARFHEEEDADADVDYSYFDDEPDGGGAFNNNNSISSSKAVISASTTTAAATTPTASAAAATTPTASAAAAETAAESPSRRVRNRPTTGGDADGYGDEDFDTYDDDATFED